MHTPLPHRMVGEFPMLTHQNCHFLYILVFLDEFSMADSVKNDETSGISRNVLTSFDKKSIIK